MTLNILQWNINGYENKFHNLSLLIQKHKPQIIALQETHLTNYNSNFHTPNKFSLYNNNDIDILAPKASRGVGLLISKTIQHKIVNCQSRILAIAAELQSKTPFVLLNMYISPADNFVEQDLHDLINRFNKLVLMLGDINA